MLDVDRAGDRCGARPCWVATESRFKYTDREGAADGVRKLALKHGRNTDLLLRARNKSNKGQTAMPTGIAAEMSGATSATLQIVSSDAACFQATLGNVKKADGAQFKAKTR